MGNGDLEEWHGDADRGVIVCAGFLKGKASNVYTQFGEDGLIQAVFDRIGAKHKTCFEVGAHDGQTHSNVARLIHAGWSAAMVEADAERFGELKARYAENPKVKCVHERVFPWTFERVLADTGVADPLGVFDLGSIDIDEQDFWLWAGMRRYHPRVMVVEFGLGRPVDQVPPLTCEDREPVPQIQAGRNMINYLGQSRGYAPVAFTECNIIFVRADQL